MRARIISALCVSAAILTICVAGFLTGCASGHKQFVYVIGVGTNEVFELRAQGDGVLVPLAQPVRKPATQMVRIAALTHKAEIILALIDSPRLQLKEK